MQVIGWRDLPQRLPILLGIGLLIISQSHHMSYENSLNGSPRRINSVYILCTLFFILFLTESVKASLYSDLIVFGDSLSDVGNTQYTTSTGLAGLFAPDTPGDAFFNGRFSNGWVWSDWASLVLTPGDTLTPQRLGGDNFAFGGARTEGTDFLTDIYIDDLATQIDTFVDTRTGDPNALYTILIGANDFFQDSESMPVDQINFLTPAIRVGNALDDLYATGARNFLLFNLPWLGLTPTYNNTFEADDWNTLSQNYNNELRIEANLFRFFNPDANLFEVDTAALLNDLIENADTMGFSNTTDSAAPGLEAGDNSYDTNLIAPNPNEYIFYDGVHPTARVHELLGFEAIRSVVPTGDYNLDGVVDTGDYNFWQTHFGSTIFLEADGNGDGIVNAADYTIWRDSYELASPLNATLSHDAQDISNFASVPEASSLSLSLVALLSVVARVRKRAR